MHSHYVVDFEFLFVFKQRTAYEVRISDWSSDVCSSDLTDDPRPDGGPHVNAIAPVDAATCAETHSGTLADVIVLNDFAHVQGGGPKEIGRASGRERVCQYG